MVAAPLKKKAGFMAETHGIRISFVRWMMLGVPIVAISVPFTWFLLTRVTLKVGRAPNAATADAVRSQREALFFFSSRRRHTRWNCDWSSDVCLPIWIKGPLRDWAEDLLDPASMRTEGWFDSTAVSRRWNEHLSGKQDSTAALWAVLTFQAWLREQRKIGRASCRERV